MSGGLARLEALVLLRRRALYAATVVSLAFLFLALYQAAPDLSAHSITLAITILPMAAAAFVVAYLEAVRIRTSVFGEILESTPKGRSWALLVQSSVLLAIWLGFALVVVVLGLVYLYVGEPVRAIKLTEIAAGISAVAMGIVLGTLVGAYVQIRGAVAVVLLGFALVQVGTNPDIGVLGLEGAGPLLTRLAPVQIPSQFLPIDIIDRNGVEHIAVILGVGGLAWGITHLTRRFRWIPGTVTLISIGLIAGNWGSSLPTTPGGAELAAYYASPRECTHVRTVEVCSFEGYESWRGRWAAELLQPPLAAWNRAVRIEQVALGDDSSPAAIAAAEAGVLSVPLSFDRTGRSGRHTSALRLQAALGAVGLPETVYDRGGGCFAGSQARAVVALWLAGAGSSNQVVSQWLTSALASTGDLFWIGVEPAQTRVTRADADLALEMLKSEEQHQIETVTWDERSSILRGRMTTEDLATELGLAVASITFQDDVGTTCD